MKAVIMAGGKGTRLRGISGDVPKPMVSIDGKPILEYQIESLKKSGVEDIILVIGYLGEVIRRYFGTGENWGVRIDYITEENPLGTAGALYFLKDHINEDFLLIFGDLMLDVDWERFMQFHRESGAWITLFGHPNTHPYDSDLIVADDRGRVNKILSKNVERDFYYKNFVNAGLYCISPDVLYLLKKPEKTDLEKTLIVNQIPHGTVYAYHSTEYVRDMGTPDRYRAVLDDVKNGIVTARNLKNRQRCVFLDRDGTVNRLCGFLNSADQFELLPGVGGAIKMLNASKYLVIIATNQPVIARGECTVQELERIHMKMETELGNYGAYIDGLYYCPHHPHKGYEGEVTELKIDCDCRKPRTGMLRQASNDFNIDLKGSWYIGDTTTDVQTGINAGMHTALLHTGEAGQDNKYKVTAEFEAADLEEAVALILEQN